jgi:hypothetical protein
MARTTKTTETAKAQELTVRVIHPETGEDITDRWFELARPRFLALAEALGRLAAKQQMDEERADDAARKDRGDQRVMFWVSNAQLTTLQRLVDMAGSQQKAFDKLIEVVDFDPDLGGEAG